MAKCEHGVYNARYCQMCTPGCSGGIYVPPPAKPLDDLPEPKKWYCTKCAGKHGIKYEDTVYCTDCGYEERMNVID
jgi:hypothetical protein